MTQIEQYRIWLQNEIADRKGATNMGAAMIGIGIEESLRKFNELFPVTKHNNQITTSIQPADMDSTSCPMGTKWQNSETEASAIWLLKMAQEHGSWRDFTQDEINKVCKHDYWFNKLTSDRFKDIIKHDDDTYSFTDGYILEMYKHCKIR